MEPEIRRGGGGLGRNPRGSTWPGLYLRISHLPCMGVLHSDFFSQQTPGAWGEGEGAWPVAWVSWVWERAEHCADQDNSPLCTSCVSPRPPAEETAEREEVSYVPQRRCVLKLGSCQGDPADWDPEVGGRGSV